MSKHCQYFRLAKYDNECHQWPDRVKYPNEDYQKAVCMNFVGRHPCVWLGTVNPGYHVQYDELPITTPTATEKLAVFNARQLSSAFGFRGVEHLIRRWLRNNWLEYTTTNRGNGGLVTYHISREAVLKFVRNPAAWSTYQVENIVDEEIRAAARAARQNAPVIAPRGKGSVNGRPRRIVWSAEDSARLIHLRDAGNSWEAVAKAMGYARTSCQLQYARLTEGQQQREAA